MRIYPRFTSSAIRLVALSLCFFVRAPFAHAELVPDGKNLTAANTYVTWYAAHIPSVFHARTRVKVLPMNDAQMESYLGDNAGEGDSNYKSGDSKDSDFSDIDGVFENDPPVIALRVTPRSDLDMLTFAHEYGHYVWFDLFTGDDRKKYEAIYRRQKAAGHLVTRYASTDLEEGFAEAFSFYASEPPMLNKRDSASYTFLKDWADSKSAKPAEK